MSSLARGPFHRTPAEQMKVQVWHTLTCVRTLIRYQAVSARGYGPFVSQFLRYQRDPAHDIFVSCTECRQSRYMPLGNDEDVDGRNRIHIVERNQIVVFIDYLARDLPRNDSAENASIFHFYAPYPATTPFATPFSADWM